MEPTVTAASGAGREPGRYLSTAAAGAASELIASAHLIAQGYHVFRALAASCPVDLVAYRGGELLKVEVKTATVRPETRYAPSLPYPTNDEWDLLVVILSTGQVLTLEPRDTREELRADFLALLHPLGLQTQQQRRCSTGGRRYHGQKYRPQLAHFVDLDLPYATTVCGLNATSWAGEADESERQRAASLPLCKSCVAFSAGDAGIAQQEAS